jgi:hypothetical protein
MGPNMAMVGFSSRHVAASTTGIGEASMGRDDDAAVRGGA